ncbi:MULTISPECIES: hypothetical protein [Mycolicibacterium]|uniref:DUF7159 domain-containing protein n=3 Tax=Mycolicibacterium gilvum TaxID=1804 RepID=E6TN49_MYCSR|nr:MULTISPECIES: hypothetical protein [Mycolicibacterium]ABP45916.1 hypothetical protein Mflv_3441 [Mycolicibacterium gilvum PYR-GCK]ADT99407.1 hypothetical protein Mspyr1_27780 [Mycolicibacterium gilvum Spyr1]MBV5246199.1 hypothetical protein [Mycolicibacterium sp. PAM1]MCV7058804.1 hypothetical protein [Mycolicibacterium gilvum]STZ43690.1 Uncharacterised protein [Mycolicibacterium gilvum]
MGVVLGLSLTSIDVAWVLVDEADGSVLDHDVIDVHDDQIAGAAARGAHAIATNSGFDVDRVRLTWDEDVASDGRTLRTQLGDMGFPAVETVPVGRAIVVMVPADLTPDLALAYGAVFAEIESQKTIASSSRRRVRGLTRMRLGAAVVGAAAAAAFGGLLLTSGSATQVEQTAAVMVPAAEAGWVAVTVPAPAHGPATAGFRVVEPDEETVAESTQPVRQVRAVAPAPAASVVTGVPHLPEGVPHLVDAAAETAAAPEPTPAAVADGQSHLPADLPDVSVVHLPDTEMTVPVNLFTALP